MTQLWYIVAPQLATNLVLNPSAERTGNYTTNATVTRSNAFAFSGFYSYFCDTFNSTAYLRLTVPALANAQHTISLTIYSAEAIVGVRVSVDGTNYYNIGTDFTLWDGDPTDPNGARYYRTFSAAQCNGATYVEIKGPTLTVPSFYVDAVQCEESTYPTTYLDCDTQGCYPNGERHASTSFRSSQERSGGRVYNLDSYSVTVQPTSGGFGAAPIELFSQPLALSPGSEYLGYKTRDRSLQFAINISGTSQANLHALRAALYGVIAPDSIRDEQPFILGYQGANTARKVWGKFRYENGMELRGQSGFLESPSLRFISHDPNMYEWGNVTQALVFNQNDASARLMRRGRAGEWAEIGALNLGIYTMARDYERGRLLLGGLFTTGTTSGGAGSTLNRVAYWDGTYMVPLTDGGGTGVDGTVFSLAIAPNGDVWVGGSFTQAGGVASTKLAKWDVSAGAWVQYNLTAGGGTITSIQDLATDKTGLLWVVGDFTDVNGVANADYVFTFDGTTVAAPAVGANGAIYNVIVAQDGTVYVKGNFTTLGGTTGTGFAKWNGTAWTAISGLTGGTYRNTLLQIANGTIYAQGDYAIYSYNGNSLVSLYDFATPDAPWCLSDFGDGSILVSLANSTAILGGADYHLIWNGTSFALPDFTSNTGNVPFLTIPSPNGPARNDVEIFGANESAVSIDYADTTTFSVISSTKTYPVILITGPTTANTYCRVQWLQNTTTGQRIYLNLRVNEGEYSYIDFRPGVKGVYTVWSGLPGSSAQITQYPGLTGEGLLAPSARIVADNPLPASDFQQFYLQAGSNIIGVFIDGTVTGVSCTLAYTPTHAGVDGVA